VCYFLSINFPYITDNSFLGLVQLAFGEDHETG
jgi:hypothetical protein